MANKYDPVNLEYYQTHKANITYEYPTMYVTRTYYIFLTRMRRMHRLNLSLNSSIVKLSLCYKSTVYYLC